ncbi:hypothetical protein HELRODRAFT_170902 [Helobdella robusta]|uniref:RING-type domain-containing protein n=1 Tax=Helobdella robusta TaxID=6412 RepID=T1F3K7_HELRO|nr:hypothetical protein HELRODRAFT_170902 [Helobdella robusta]ESO06872.1 hypothetical protein HELRODRAFT_170902 [Helobdella robusta]
MPPKSRTLSDLITCSICLERFKQPKTLPCMHTFCLECIGKCLKLHNFSCELECALCKRSVRFAHSRDIKYLPVDHVIVQISDLVDAERQASKVINDQLVVRLCDLCKMKESCTEKVPNALSRCQKCKLSFCNECSVKHNSNPMFSSHISFDLRDSSIFCKQHYDNVIEFFCKNCLFLMCTVCVLEHDSTHNLEHWDEVLLSKCEKVLTETMQMASKKSQEIKSHIKKLETLRQTYQESLFCTQLRIKSKTNDLIEMIRKREKKLLTECQNKFDNIFKEVGLDVIADLKFNQTRMDLLCEDLNATLLDKNKLKCLFAFQNLSKFHSVVQNFSLDTIVKASCFSSLSSSPPSSGRLRAMNKTICFLPDQLNESLLQIGTLSECNVHSVVDLDLESFTPQARQSSSNDVSSGHKRVKLILNAIDKFGHKKDSTKSYGRMKSSDMMSVGAGDVAASTQLAATATVNVDLSATSADSTNILNNKISDICTINNNINDNNFDNMKSNSSISNNNTNNNADNNEPDADVHSSTESEIVSSSPAATTFSSDVVLVGSHHSIRYHELVKGDFTQL